MCNNDSDCMDNSDEGGECLATPNPCTQKGCQHNCFVSPKGAGCFCNKGYEVPPNGPATECQGTLKNYIIIFFLKISRINFRIL